MLLLEVFFFYDFAGKQKLIKSVSDAWERLDLSHTHKQACIYIYMYIYIHTHININHAQQYQT